MKFCKYTFYCLSIVISVVIKNIIQPKRYNELKIHNNITVVNLVHCLKICKTQCVCKVFNKILCVF